jgi:hypothetical protein
LDSQGWAHVAACNSALPCLQMSMALAERQKMLNAPSSNWTCHFPAVAVIVTIVLCYLLGIIALYLIIPGLIFYSLLVYLGYTKNAIRILVDQERLFVRQGLNSEVEYNLHEISSFLVITKRFKTILDIKPLEWIFPNPYEPVGLFMLMTNGSKKPLFSYQEASPFKLNWSKFATKLEQKTGKIIKFQEDEQFGLENCR